MYKTKLVLNIAILFYFGQIGYGQDLVTIEGFEKAVNFANCKYVKFSLNKEQEKLVFNDSCNCSDNPNLSLIVNSINQRKTKTVDFAKEFNRLKKLRIESDSRSIAAFLTVSIFENSSQKVNRIFEYGLKRQNDQEFIDFKSELNDELIDLMGSYLVDQKADTAIRDPDYANPIESVDNLESEVAEVEVLKSQNKTTLINESNMYWLGLVVLLIIFIISVLRFKYLRAEKSDDYNFKKVAGQYIYDKFIQNELEIENLKVEIDELKKQIRKIQFKEGIAPQEDDFQSSRKYKLGG